MKTILMYRVILKVGYHEDYFEFASEYEAIEFAKTALIHTVPCEDDPDKELKAVMEIVNKELEKGVGEGETKEGTCSGCKHVNVDPDEEPCDTCKHNFVSHYEEKED